MINLEKLARIESQHDDRQAVIQLKGERYRERVDKRRDYLATALQHAPEHRHRPVAELQEMDRDMLKADGVDLAALDKAAFEDRVAANLQQELSELQRAAAPMAALVANLKRYADNGYSRT